MYLKKPVIIDGSLRNFQWYSNYFPTLRQLFSSLHIGIIYITSSLNTILQRAKEREDKIGNSLFSSFFFLLCLSQGRIVPIELIIETYQQIPNTIEKLSKFVDYFCLISNDHNIQPKLISSSFNNKKNQPQLEIEVNDNNFNNIDTSSFDNFRELWWKLLLKNNENQENQGNQLIDFQYYPDN